jgi:flagellar hook protein FlgE
MFSSIYSSLSGLINFSKGLDVISNNVANLNTPGFKLSDAHFQDLVYKFQTNGQESDNRTQSQIGRGVALSSTSIDFQQGETRNTGNDLNVAIDGNGFFIFRDDEQNQFFSRLGQFQFDEENYLVDSNTRNRVAGISGSDQLTDINISDLTVNPAVATTEVTLVNNLSTGSTTHTVSNIEVFDNLGGTHTLSIDFTNNTGVTTGSWLFDVKDSTTATISSGEVRFGATGAPIAGFNTHTFTFAPTGAVPANLTLNFGDVGSLSGATSFSAGTTSTLQFGTQNGLALGAITSTEFDTDGVLSLNYSNGESVTAATLALAWFTDLQSLELFGSSLFKSTENNDPIIGKANEGLNGSISPNSIELSNVDLTEEFTNLIVVQRGFQGSSQIISASNELIQELLDLRSGR